MLEDYLRNKNSEQVWCEKYEIDINIMEAAAMSCTSSLEAYIKSANRLQGLLHLRCSDLEWAGRPLPFFSFSADFLQM